MRACIVGTCLLLRGIDNSKGYNRCKLRVRENLVGLTQTCRVPQNLDL